MVSIRTVFNCVVIFALLLAAVGFYVQAHVDDYATDYINQQLADALVDSDFEISVDSADYISGAGLQLHGLRVIDNAAAEPKLLCDVRSVTVEFPTDIQDLVLRQIEPTSILIDGAVVRLNQALLGPAFQERLQSVWSQLPASGKLVRTQIRNSECHWDTAAALVSASSNRGRYDSGKPARSKVLSLKQIDADIHPSSDDQQAAIDFVVRCGGGLTRKCNLRGNVDLARKVWSAEVEQLLISLNDELLEYLPDQEQLDRSYLQGLSGTVAVRARASAAFSDPVPNFVLRCRCAGVSVNNDKLPEPVRNLNVDLQVDNAGLKIESLTGDYAQGSFQFTYQQQGLLERLGWSLSGGVKKFKFDERIAMAIPGFCEKFCRDFSPAGYFDLQVAADSEGGKKITSQITDMSFSFHRFPYRVKNCIGNVAWIGDKLNFNVQTIEHDQLLQFAGQVDNPGDQATFRFEFGTEGRLPIDEKLIACLQHYPAMQQIVRDFRPAGFVGGSGVVEKLAAGSRSVNRDINIDLHDSHLRYQKFDYPMEDVSGRIHIDDDGFTFTDIQGNNGSGTVVCNGSWNPRAGLQLALICESTSLDRHLRNALTSDLQEIWDGFRPQGVLPTGRVFLDLPPGSAYADIRVVANLGDPSQLENPLGVSVFPTWFPYRIDKVAGSIEIGGGGVTVNKFIGQHGRTRLGFNATGNYSTNGWSVTLDDMLAVQVKADDELLSAVPVDLAEAIRHLEYEGQFNVSGQLRFASDIKSMDSSRLNPAATARQDNASGDIQLVNHTEAQAVDVDSAWDVRLDIDQGKMLMGLPLENIFGSVRLRGSMRRGISESAGEVTIDSLTVYGSQITNIQGPLWIDNNQSLAGEFARTGSQASRSLVGNVFGGKISFDGMVSHIDEYPFRLKTKLEKCRLEDLAAELAPEMKDIAGDGYGYLQLAGQANELHTYEGRGSLSLQNAKIHELPVVLSLLKILSIKEVNRTAFDSSDISFSVSGDQIEFDRIELIGDAISLIGNGYLKLMRHADINFYSVVGRNRFYIPLLSELYRAGSQRILWIHIGGPLQNLKTSRKVLPRLNDSLRALLGTTAERPRGR